MAIWTIVAVAIGDRGNDRIIRNNTNLRGVRDYIPGLISGLGDLGYVLGTAYEIDYRERTRSELDTNAAEAFRVSAAQADHIILGMSTKGVKGAQSLTTTIKLVGIVSDRTPE